MTETKRLTIKPLNYSQLLKYIKNDHSLENELGLSETNITVTSEFREALEQAILPCVAEKENNYLYFTLWTIIAKAENKMVGDLCFKGLPDANGAIEIGYGIYEDFRGNGYMAEAVGGIIQWAAKQPGVKAITASTDANNIASFTVLQKNKFIRIGESEELFHWKLEL